MGLNIMAIGARFMPTVAASTKICQPGEAALFGIDPVSQYNNIISGGGPPNGGARGNFLAEIYPGGNPPTDPRVLANVVQKYSLLPELTNNADAKTFVCIQKVDGSPMRRLLTLSAVRIETKETNTPTIPAVMQLYNAMNYLYDWNKWMPRNKESKGIPIGPGMKFHQVLYDAGAIAGEYDYRVLFEYEELNGGAQIRWKKDEGTTHGPAYKRRPKTRGLKRIDGSWTFDSVLGDENEVLMAYEMHIEPAVNQLLLRTVGPAITLLTLREFDQTISAMANYAFTVNRDDIPTWKKGDKTNPCGRKYSLKKIRG